MPTGKRLGGVASGGWKVGGGVKNDHHTEFFYRFSSSFDIFNSEQIFNSCIKNIISYRQDHLIWIKI